MTRHEVTRIWKDRNDRIKGGTMEILCNLMMVFVIGTTCSSATRAQSPSWAQYGFLATHSSFNSFETTLTSSNVSTLTLKFAADMGAYPVSAPVIGQEMAFVTTTDGTVHAFDADNGAPLWSRLACGGQTPAQPALGSSALYVGDAGGDLAAYDPTTGNQLWCMDLGGKITRAPALQGSTIYLTNGFQVVAADQSSGTPRWFFTPADSSPVTNTPAIQNGVVYATGGNSVFALCATTGQLLWRTNLPPQANISAPSVSGNLVYVGGTNLYALLASNGHIRWTQTSVGVNVSTPAIAYGRVFVNSEDPQFGLFAFDANTGALLWRNRTPEEPLSTLAIANHIVYDIAQPGPGSPAGGLEMFSTDTGAFLGAIVDPDGHAFNISFNSQPAVVNGTIYVPTADYYGVNRLDAFALP